MKIRVRLSSLSILACSGIIFTIPALAQEQQADQLEEVVVTGSYIYTGLDSPSPVSVLSGEDMVNFAPADLSSFFFDNVPQNFGSEPINQTENDGQSRARSMRNASINLRGLGDENSLVVLNGRRTIAYPVPDGTGWNRVDINSIVPRIAVQRTELLLDGGSATFGSAPVAGVANFVTRNNFRGFDFSMDNRMLEDAMDAKNLTISALFGAGDNQTNVVAAIEFHQEDLIELIEIDPEFSFSPDVTPETGEGLEPQNYLSYKGTGRGAPTWVDPDCGNPAFGSPYFAHYPAYEDDDGYTRETTIGDATLCARPSDFDRSGTLLNNNVKQIIAFVRGEHNFSNSLRANVEINFSRQRFDDIDQWGDNGSERWVVQPVSRGSDFSIHPTNPGFVRAQSLGTGFGLKKNKNTEAYMVGETLPFLSEASAFNKNDVLRVALGIEGDINPSWSWMLNTSAAYSEVENGARDMLIARYPLAIAGLGGTDCGVAIDAANADASRGQGNCSYYNPFMSSALPDAQTLGVANDPALMEWLSPLRIDRFLGEFYDVDARVVGEFGNLPAGPIGIAAGVAFRSEYVERDADAQVNGGDFASLGVFNDFSGRQSVSSLYVEAALPVHADIDLQIAARKEDYEEGFSETSPKIAALWRASDRLTFRSSWGTSFKGPSISQTSAATIFTGMGPARMTVGGVRYGSRGGAPSFSFETTPEPDLKPQTSDNITLGFDFVVNDQIDVGASFVRIEFKDRIVAPSANVVLGSCVLLDGDGIPVTSNGKASGALQYRIQDDGLCVKGVIDSTLIKTVNGVDVIENTNLNVLASKPKNLGFLDADFLDVRTNMRFDTPIGLVTFSPSATMTLRYEFPVDDVVGRAGLCPDGLCSAVGRQLGRGFANGVNSMPHWQGVFPVMLGVGNHNIRFIARYRDSLNGAIEDFVPSDSTPVFIHEEGQWTGDLNWNYTFNQGGTTVGLSINNLFATDPPDHGSSRYDRRRREFGLQFRHTFEN